MTQHWFKTLFAATGTKTAVPDVADPSGFISYDTGYGPDYQRVLGTDPLAKTIERDKLNQVLYDMTGAIQQYQMHAFPEFITTANNGGAPFAYDVDAIVRYDSGGGFNLYQNTITANINLPTGAGWVLKSGGFASIISPALTGTPTINGLNLSPNEGKNLLINSNGLVNQRGYISGTATTVANQYTVDRWRVVTLGQNLTFTTTNGVTTFTAPAGGVEQVIENLNVLGGSYVLTIGGTAAAVVAESADNITYTTVTPTAGVYTVTGGYYVRVRFSGGTFSKPKFEEGTVPTPYSLPEFGGEVQACQRYYEKLSNIYIDGLYAPAAGSSLDFSMKITPKRASPTITQLSATPINSTITYSGYADGVLIMSFLSAAAGRTGADNISLTASAEL